MLETMELTKWLLACEKSLKGGTVDTDTVKLWAGLLESEGVTNAELASAFTGVLKAETFFPTPAEILKRIRRNRPSFAVIEDPVLVPSENGYVLTSRARCEAEGLDYIESESEPKSLPSPSNVLANAKNRRMKAADIIAADKSMPPASSVDEIEAKREAMRRQVGK